MTNEHPYRTYVMRMAKNKHYSIYYSVSLTNGKVKRFITEKLGFAVVVLKEEAEPGILLNLFKESIWEDCDCAVAIMSPDERVFNKRFFPRQNVLYEIGYCQGFWDHYHWDEDLECVFLLKEETVEVNSDLNGFKVIPTDGNITKSPQLEDVLEGLFYYLDEREEEPVRIKKSRNKTPVKKAPRKRISFRMARKK
jgi:predicted nucleotide-binding protein